MWSPSSGKSMADMLRGCKGVKYDETRVKFIGSPDDEAYGRITLLANEIASI